jgi:four helix bundle protein
VRRLDDIIAWQLADDFKRSVYRLLAASSRAWCDVAFRQQLQASAASAAINIGEGFYRFNGRDFARFLSIALASLGKAELWLRDGVDRGRFTSRDCEPALNLAKRCRVATFASRLACWQA